MDWEAIETSILLFGLFGWAIVFPFLAAMELSAVRKERRERWEIDRIEREKTLRDLEETQRAIDAQIRALQ